MKIGSEYWKRRGYKHEADKALCILNQMRYGDTDVPTKFIERYNQKYYTKLMNKESIIKDPDFLYKTQSILHDAITEYTRKHPLFGGQWKVEHSTDATAILTRKGGLGNKESIEIKILSDLSVLKQRHSSW